MLTINEFLIQHDLRINTSPSVSPDFCLDWPTLARAVRSTNDAIGRWNSSRIETAAAFWSIVEDRRTGDCAWLAEFKNEIDITILGDGILVDDRRAAFPATFDNLLQMKNLVQEFDAESTVFPTAGANLGRSTLGIGSRFTTLHWPAVEWAMTALNMGITASQNSIPRELVFDVDEMLAGRLDRVPFPFLGADVPEGHQGQSIQGMAHGAVLSKLKTGFHRRRIEWSLNADHQPIGGRFDEREDRLVSGAILASYITFDLSPQLAVSAASSDHFSSAGTPIPPAVRAHVDARLESLKLTSTTRARVIAEVWPAIQKMKRRDLAYRRSREQTFTTSRGREYLRELSIDELPGVTTPDTTAVVLALCEAMDIRLHFIAPAFGFQKNVPYPDNDELRSLIERQWTVCHAFDVSLGFHSGSGKSAGNYDVMGDVTGGRLEVKTSGRYTYEMGRALAASDDAGDQALWRDWYAFTRELAISAAHSPNDSERQYARAFIMDALSRAGQYNDVFASTATTRAALNRLRPSPDHMFWFEYNFLFVLAAGGRADKAALGDHTADGYRQRARFYRISETARLNYLRNVASYILFLAEHTRLVLPARCANARRDLDQCRSLQQFLAAISPG